MMARIRWGALVLFSVCGCDTGSEISFDRDGASCAVSMTRNSDGFSVQMTLSCTGDGTECYSIELLSCQGEDKAAAVPIDLTGADDGCPGEAYCVDNCADGLEAPATLWDTPSLLAVDGCNIYEDA